MIELLHRNAEAIDTQLATTKWLALKLDENEWMSFDSISFYTILEQYGESVCREHIEHLQETPWRDLKYSSEPMGPTIQM